MITMTVPEWLVWVCLAAFVFQTILNIITVRLQRKNREASAKLFETLMRLMRSD